MTAFWTTWTVWSTNHEGLEKRSSPCAARPRCEGEVTGLSFDEAALAASGARLIPSARLAFALACAERLLPNYLAFHRKVGWGRPETLRKALDSAWEALIEGTLPGDAALAELELEVVACEPETEGFDTILVSSALDAACAAGHVLATLRTHEVAEMVAVASLARDSVDMYVQEAESMSAQTPDLEERIRLHPLMQAELRYQAELLLELEVDALDYRAVKQKHRAPLVGSLGHPIASRKDCKA